LREIGVDYAQGYAIGKPRPFDNFDDAFVATRNSPQRIVA
jgi:EAL domain-containing protein (putative c-di-GMP-specific phosphodiesterase class I)